MSHRLMIAAMLIAPFVFAIVPELASGQGAQAPETFRVSFDTSKGTFVIEVHRAWAPIGADHFYQLVKGGFYNGCRFFRVVPGFMVQFGMAGDPAVQAAHNTTIKDDPVKQSNKRGYVTFAKTGAPNSRSTQIFINFADNSSNLDRPGMGFAPFGQVVSGMDVVDKIDAQYGERPDQGQIRAAGNAYLMKSFPNLDYVKKATIEAKGQ